MKKKERKKCKALKVVGIFLSIGMVAYLAVTTHPQIVVGTIQKMVFGDKAVNSYEPLHDPIDGLKENGQYLISEIKYDEEYPNSYLDITYPNEDRETARPTIVYFHGGGFFFGSKSMGDPLAESEMTYLLDDLCSEGYNLVSVDYAFVPDHHFPVPLIQMDRAIQYLFNHQEEYHLNMDELYLFGSSAGAIMTSQYGSIISNPEYADLVGITPYITASQVKAVIIDDAPLDYDHFTLGTKILVGNYIKGSIYLSKEEIGRFNNIEHIDSSYPKAFLLGSDEYGYDMSEMYEKLQEVGVESELVYPLPDGIHTQHGFVSNERNDETAKAAYTQMIAFMKKVK